jgi:hypothetical protein
MPETKVLFRKSRYNQIIFWWTTFRFHFGQDDVIVSGFLGKVDPVWINEVHTILPLIVLVVGYMSLVGCMTQD